MRRKTANGLGARVAAAWGRGDDYIKYQQISQLSLYPSFVWKITPKTEIVWTNEFLKDKTPSRDEGHGTRTNGSDSPRGLPTLGAAPSETLNPANPIASSAAAKVERHLKVPVRKSSESLICKPAVPLEVAAKTSDKKMRVKTIRHTDCIEVGHDKFDEMVTNFLHKIGETNIVSITPLTYTHIDIGSQKIMTEYAVLIVYKG